MPYDIRSSAWRQPSLPLGHDHPVDMQDFIAKYPSLWHLADEASWASIQRHGLLSTAEISRRWEVPADDREALLSCRRPTLVTLTHPDLGLAVLRDQHPLSEERLAPALTGGMTVEGWLRMLNSLVFFFPSKAAVEPLYSAYGDRAAVVLQVRTRSLVEEHDARIRLAGINTGNTMRRPAPRGADTFLPIRRYDHGKRKVQEVAVMDGVHDLVDHLISVERWLPDGSVTPLPVG